MLVYILFICLTLVLRYSLLTIPLGSVRIKKENTYLYLLATVLLLLTALRGAGVGTDTRNYLIMYIYYVPNYSFSEIYPGLKGSLGTYYLFKTCSSLHLPPQVLLGIIELVYLSAIVRFINKFSRDKLYSFLCFFIMVGLYSFSVPALKQASAMGLALHAFLYLYDKKTTKACLCVILAYFFHKSSLIFLFGLLLYFVRNKKFYYYFIGTFLLLCLLSADRIVVLMLDILHDDHFTNYYEETGVYSWVAFFYYLVLLLASMSFRKLYDKYNREESRIMFGFAIIALALQSLSSVVPSAFRLATFYVPFFIILLPNSFSIGSKTGQQYKIFILLLMLLFYFYTNRNGGNIVPYKFFWQDYNITYQKFGG